MSPELVIALLAAAVQAGTPILFATLGEILSEKSGVMNLGVEGVMAFASFAGFYVCFATGSAWLGFLAGGVSGAFLCLLHAVVCQVFLGSQVVSGLALAIFGVGLSTFLGTPFVGTGTEGFDKLSLPLLADIPILGPVFFRQDALVYLCYLLPLGLWFFLNRTSLGLRLRAAGEMPAAAAAAGLRPRRLRVAGSVAGGFLGGLGGAYISLAHMHLWTTGLSGGRGWVAVALVVFAAWRPGRAVLGAFLFGGVMAFQLRLQATGTNIPSSLLMMLPYALTIVAVVAPSLRRRASRADAAPAALGVNIEPQD
ncbi:nucleoside ABC transporter membrane protein [Humidesulfovibrio mexicanus]|uniref:Nucleoside ABC transporter membrane protein n=1 Tax=Humidesulfovibrio mexicanus TaxID=147047 RepID=A0A239B0U5_9BACT|nr:ABC transporter permease [Humidesulfovibrio mexicanus]SNS01595.1 nucleoside ABC transporter membrane protein [Humidesulfovibrio mexicanus]